MWVKKPSPLADDLHLLNRKRAKRVLVKVKWKWSEVKVKWSESIFGPLNLFNLRYIKEGVRGNNNIGIKKCTTNFLWVLNFGEVGEIFKNFQNHTTTVTFFKNGLQLVIFEKFTRDFPYKIEGNFFLWDFFWKLKAILEIFTWISFVKLKVSSIFGENGGKSN